MRTRVGQEASKRLDLAIYRAGLHAQAKLNGQGPSAGQFLFSPDELPARITLQQRHLPAQVEAICAEADGICAHKFRLLGYTGLDYGREIDWHLDAVHRKRAPLKPWFKIDFLNFAEVGDHKITWELNRHQHLVTLAKAWRLTQDERYARELLEQWYAWQKANPYPLGINWGSSLEAAFRSLSWLWVRSLLTGCAAVPATFESDLLQALAKNGRYIYRYLSTYFSPNTHLIGEAVALFFIGTVCPQISGAASWREEGWRIVLKAAKDQVRFDGVYFEQSLYYHVYALDFFQHARRLAAQNHIEIPGVFDQTLRKMLDFVQALCQAGPPDGFGDDDGGRVFDPQRNRAEHMSDPLAVGATTFGRNDLTAASLTEEAIWLFGEQAIACLASHGSDLNRALSVGFEAGGVYVSACAENAELMAIDAGPQGTGRSGHGHADALSVRVHARGSRWLIDPGTYCYISDTDQRSHFRGTAAHNTLRIDSKDQAVEQGPFAWNSLPTVRTERWVTGETFSLFSGSHTGYLRLAEAVLHRRSIFHLHGCFWLVLDSALGKGAHELEVFWHFAPDLKVVEAINGCLAQPEAAEASNQTGFGLVTVLNSNWKCEVVAGDFSPAYGCKVPAPTVRVTAQAQLPARLATVLIPSIRDPELGTLVEMNGDFVCGYRFTHGSQTDYVIFNEREGTSWSMGPWSSDADFLHCRVENRRVIQLVFCAGSFVKVQGQGVLTHHRKIERFEWRNQSGVRRIFSSDDTAGHSLSEGPFESDVPVF